VRILFDTKVILDVLLDREPHASAAAALMSQVEVSKIQGFLCATTITTLYYLLAKTLGQKEAHRYIKILMALFEIAPVNRVVIENALDNNFKDFEDAVLYESAVHSNVEYIVTRNVKDFKSSKIPVFEPVELNQIIENLK